MFRYSQYSLHAQISGLLSFGPSQRNTLRTRAELGSPICLRGRSNTRQQSCSLRRFHSDVPEWDLAAWTQDGQCPIHKRTECAEAKGVLL